MNAADWQLELYRLLSLFEEESKFSLRKIKRCFEVLDRPFDEYFRKYLVKMLTLRLDTSFNIVQFERSEDNRMQITLNSNEPAHVNDDAPQNGKEMELKTENNVDDTIEIFSSDDEGDDDDDDDDDDDVGIEDFGMQAINDPIEGRDLNNGNDFEALVKCEPKVESLEDEMMDLPIVEFDPSKYNESPNAAFDATFAELPDRQIQPSVSSKTKKESKRVKVFECTECSYTSRYKYLLNRHHLIHGDIKPFKCEQCEFTCRQKGVLNRHQRIHDRQKMMGIPVGANDVVYECPHCDEKFIKWNGLRKHLTQTHKNNQRLFNCSHCMRRFARKTDKDRHELRCQERRYECYLCNNYVTRTVCDVRVHMRTHSGAKPFECAVCSKCFRQKDGLRRHMNSIHVHISESSTF